MGKQFKRISIGIDQSYTATGLSVCCDGVLTKVTSTQFKGLESRTEKRKELIRILHRLIPKAQERASQVVIICERIRTFSQGQQQKGGKQSFGLRPTYLIMTGALIAAIVDTAYDYNVKVFSVDTRSWKSKIVGSSKGDGKGNKALTVKFIENKGFNMELRRKKTGKNKGEVIWDDDAADSACIALYAFLPKNKRNLKLEE